MPKTPKPLAPGTRVLCPGGTGQYMHTIDGGVHVRLDKRADGGTSMIATYAPHQVRRESFLRYCTRASGMGQTGWYKVATILLFAALFCVGAITADADEVLLKVVLYTFGLGLPVALVAATWMQWRNIWR